MEMEIALSRAGRYPHVTWGLREVVPIRGLRRDIWKLPKRLLNEPRTAPARLGQSGASATHDAATLRRAPTASLRAGLASGDR